MKELTNNIIVGISSHWEVMAIKFDLKNLTDRKNLKI